MKTASNDLIDLLANASTFVMWETFTFTLIDGSEVVYTTYDQDAPPIPATEPLLFLLDTFTGTGTLADHVGELGATWSVMYDDQSPLTDFVLDGAGSVSAVVDAFNFLYGSSLPNTGTGNFDIKASVLFPEPPSGSIASIELFAVNDPVDLLGFIVQAFINDGETEISVQADCSNGDDSGSFGPVSTGLLPGVAHQIRVVCSNARKTFTVFADGVQIGSLSLDGSIPDVQFFGFAVGGVATGNPSILSIEGNML